MTIAPLSQQNRPASPVVTNLVTHPTIGASSFTWGSILNASIRNIVEKVNELINANNQNATGFTVGELRHWVGNEASITAVWGSGWRICNGTNGTPNLAGRALIGSGGSFALNDSGGSLQATTAAGGAHAHGNTEGHALTEAELPSHTHGVTDPGHAHNYARASATSGVDNDTDLSAFIGNSNVQTGSATTGITLDSTGSGEAHSHNVSEGGSHTHTVDINPPHHVVHIIMYFG